MQREFNPNVYDQGYYESHCGLPYSRDYDNGYWLRFFGAIAESLIREYTPKTALDVGCAKGFLVEQLRIRGVDATGFDISTTALDEVSPDIRDYCRYGSIDDLNMYSGHYDMITCIEILEHVTPEMADRAIELMCQHTDLIVFSSTPDDFTEPTHINVQPVQYWVNKFASHGYRLSNHDAWATHVITAHAMVFVSPLVRVAHIVEEKLSRFMHKLEVTKLDKVMEELESVSRGAALISANQREILVLQESNHALKEECKKLTNANEKLAETLETMNDSISRLQRTNDELEERSARQQRTVEDKDVHIRNVESHLESVRNEVRAMSNTKGWRALNILRMVRFSAKHPLQTCRKIEYSMKHLGLRGTIDRIHGKYLKEIQTSHLQVSYDEWMRQLENNNDNYCAIVTEVDGWDHQPLVSVLMPTYNSKVAWLEAAIESLIRQPYNRWELVVSDDASTDSETVGYLDYLSKMDDRINVVKNVNNLGISGATNVALQAAKGELISFMDHDDCLSPWALYEVVKVYRETSFDICYSDEDKLDENGRYCDAFFKPDYSPDYLMSCNYFNHLTVYSRNVTETIGLFRGELDGSQDHDYLLRAVEKFGNITHIPKVLYHWRKVPGSTAQAFDSKSYAHDAGKLAIGEALNRRGEEGDVIDTGFPGHYRVRRHLIQGPLVSIIIPIKDKVDLLKTCLDSIRKKSTYRSYEILIVDNGSVEKQTTDYLQRQSDCRVLRYDIPFNYSRLNNLAAAEARGDYLLFLNNDTEVITPEWLEEMLQHGTRTGVGVVGSKLLYPDNRIQHAGVVLGIGGVAGHSHKYFPRHAGGYFSTLADIRNYSAVTGACMLVPTELFRDINGFDEVNLGVAFNDVDLCLRIRERGYLCVYTPYAELYHFESVSRGDSLDPAEVYYMLERWGNHLSADPYYNVHLSKTSEDFQMSFTLA